MLRSTAITRSHETAVRHLEAGIESEQRIAEGAEHLEETTKLLRDVLHKAGADISLVNEDILPSNESFRDSSRQMLEILATRLESATSLQVTSVQRATASGDQLERIALDLVAAQRRLAGDSQQLLAAIQALIARRSGDGLPR